MLMSLRNDSTNLQLNPTLSRTRPSLAWTRQGDRMSGNLVDSLLDTATDAYERNVPSGIINWADTVIQLLGRDGQASFDIEPEPGAKHSVTWRDAVEVVQAMKSKMAKDGYYERSAEVVFADMTRVATAAIFLESEMMSIGSSTGIMDAANETSGVNTTASPASGSVEDDISVRVTHRRNNRNSYYVVKALLSDAISDVSANVADGLGDKVPSGRDRQWSRGHIGMWIWHKRGALHLMNWKAILQVLRLTDEQVQDKFGYTEFDADIVWQVGGVEQIIGMIVIDQNFETPATLGNTTTGALGNTTSLRDDSGNVYLRVNSQGKPVDALSVLALFRGATGVARDEVAEGKGDDPVGWKELNYLGTDVSLIVNAQQGARHGMTWSNTLVAEDLMLRAMGAQMDYRELDVVVAWNENGGRAEVIGNLRLISLDRSDGARTVHTA